ncbi:trk system potassium uptake protein TrkA [Balneicella halophila]|uniref:Trk system potassium uptake protein TrkA n=1 Tax=Balneicella halophila TaxID=1537566 RepID=A0A7L4UQP0_BALHA|nr:Trk system potassium transporter TrkA [Balneicella halophila]PVX52070.1 trk system potassium uptake protein TrkA [Balneicella halophila]
MKIVIAGAGEVGVYLARMLSHEKHDITLMDIKEENLAYANAHYEILTQVGSSSSIADLRAAGVSKARLFIAVTESEEINITSCVLAKKLGAKRVVARVDNKEYIQKSNQDILQSMSIDEFVYPEALAAEEIVASLKMTGAHLIHEFIDTGMVFFSVDLKGKSPLIDNTLGDVRKLYPSRSYKAVAIKREGKTIILKEHNRFRKGDLIFIISKKDAIDEALKICGTEEFALKNIMILGGSRIGQRTASLLQHKYNVKLLEIDKEKSFEIADSISDTLVVCGDGRNVDLLREEGVGSMDVFIAVTGNSETNIFSCLLAKKLGVKATIAEVEHTDFIDLAETVGVGTMINKKLIAAGTIYKHTTDTEITHFKQITDAEADILELVAKKNSRITKEPLADILFLEEATIGAIIRDGVNIIAYGDVQIQEGDRAVVFSMPHLIKKVEKYFN